MALTPPPTPPNTGNPAQLEERADTFFGWFPTMVSDFNSELGRLNSRYRVFRTGTANELILTGGFTSIPAGTSIAFRATATNTVAPTINLDGLGVQQTRTITGATVPAGYLRTDVDTVATYNGVNWILGREVERGSNANGDFTRFADGTQICSFSTGALTANSAAGSVFFSDTAQAVFPSAFSSEPVAIGRSVYVSGSPVQWVGVVSASLTSASTRLLAAASGAIGSVSGIVYGRWY